MDIGQTVTISAMSSRRRLIAVVVLEAVAGLVVLGLLAMIFLRLPPASLPALITPAGTLTPGPTQARPTGASTLTAVRALIEASPTAAAAATLAPSTAAAEPTATVPVSPTVTGQVDAASGGLRLRQTPGTAGTVIDGLTPLTPLQIVGRTADNGWLEVLTPKPNHGWVRALYVDVTGSLDAVKVTGTAVDAPVAAPDTTSAYLSGVTSHARQIFLSGLALGNRADVFSKVGDSNTDNPAFLTPFDQGNFNLGQYTELSPTIHYFSGSFSRASPAAVGSFSTSRELDPAFAKPGCAAGETPLACEYRLNKPSVALILLGTGDQHSWQGFEARYRKIIEYTIQQGIIPVLITKADDLESKEDTAPPGFTNAVIRRLAQEYDVPLLDLRAAVDPLPNHGCGPDGFHYNTPPDGQSANFDTAHLLYGFNMRNLTALQALDALRQEVLYNPPSPQ